MIVNADITIFNKRYDATERTERFFPTPIKECSFVRRHGVISPNIELSLDETYAIRIPIDADFGGATYVDAMTYKGLADAAGYWTIQTGDYVAKGTYSGGPMSETDIQKSFGEVAVVMNFTDNTDRPSDDMKHWRIGGK